MLCYEKLKFYKFRYGREVVVAQKLKLQKFCTTTHGKKTTKSKKNKNKICVAIKS